MFAIAYCIFHGPQEGHNSIKKSLFTILHEYVDKEMLVLNKIFYPNGNPWKNQFTVMWAALYTFQTSFGCTRHKSHLPIANH